MELDAINIEKGIDLVDEDVLDAYVSQLRTQIGEEQHHGFGRA